MQYIETYNGIEDSFLINSGKPGPTVVFFGGTHGNEISGVKAIHAFRQGCKDQILHIIKGKIRCIAPVNQHAYEQFIRYMYHDMNRCFTQYNKQEHTHKDYEHDRAKHIMHTLDRLQPTYCIDFHSTSSPSIPFAFCEDPDHPSIYHISIPYIVSGRNRLNIECIAGDIESYTRTLGAISMTYEAGFHTDDPDGLQAYTVMIQLLQFYEMIDTHTAHNTISILGDSGNIQQKKIQIHDVYTHTQDTFRYLIDDIYNFRPITKQEPLAQDGTHTIYAPYNGVLILPKQPASIHKGKEAFFTGY